MSSTWKTLVLLLFMMGVPLAVMNRMPVTVPAVPVHAGANHPARAVGLLVSPVTLRFIVIDPLVQLAVANPFGVGDESPLSFPAEPLLISGLAR